jgi:hypothetical protein
MNYPESKYIININYTYMNYLTNTYTDSLNSNDFDLVTGKPLVSS